MIVFRRVSINRGIEKFHILKLQTLISEPEPSLKTVIRNEVVIEMVQNLVCGAHLILTQYRVRLARSERGSTDIWISGVFSGPSTFSEPWFSSPEVEFWTLSENLRWCVIVLTNIYRVEQLPTRLRAQIGFSKNVIFQAQTMISEPALPPKNWWSGVNVRSKWF